MELRETKCGILCLLDREELKMLNQKEVKKNDYPQLISLWRSSVEATHLFLSQADIDKIEVVLPDYFQQVQLSMWLNDNQLLGTNWIYLLNDKVSLSNITQANYKDYFDKNYVSVSTGCSVQSDNRIQILN